ncbi:MAG TPA: hypothetical protein IGS17_13750 [Oscillatoriales cyanobacterium M59_W2019_021]|nr:MAG: hypothetical protein D6728_14955 [Cyanobacteria bacterium J055]HIK30783.1 hypothetical protein [Oscillatoriales cyanobacterium M4454_W2019_049]HIK51968.1 hypothetical protein [Oscillatoriales cyanobacterium M59_W2019_021]
MNTAIDLHQIQSDIITGAKLANVEYSESVIGQILDIFGDKFSQQVIDLKTTTKTRKKRGFYFRYLEENSHGFAWERAKTSKILVNQNRAVDRLVPEIYDTLSLLADGVDFEVNYGLTKIWQFPKTSLSVEAALKISSLPKSVHLYTEFFNKYHLDIIHLFAADYQNNSMNLYFTIVHPDYKTPQLYRNLLSELNFEIPSYEVLEILTQTGSMAFTFNWTSCAIERLCCYIGGFNRKNTPKNIDPLVTTFVQNCPSLVTDPDFILGWSFGSKESSGTYLKMEIDYSGNVVSFFYKLLKDSHTTNQQSNLISV